MADEATIYRRWSSKARLVIDALATIKPPLDDIDTGSLDGDLAAMIDVSCGTRTGFGSRVMCGIASAFGRDPELLSAFEARFTQPRIEGIAVILHRARERGELPEHLEIPFVATIVPSLVLQRALMTGQPADRSYIEQVVGQVLLPMLGRPARTRERPWPTSPPALSPLSTTVARPRNLLNPRPTLPRHPRRLRPEFADQVRRSR